MKKKVRVKSKSICPLSNEGVQSQLNEIQNMLDTLSKFVEGEAKKAESRHLYLQNCFYHLSNRKEI